ncbi:hypothetical protein [Thermoplasma sp. Kam2015]|uniref:hypothetical protein n=1 Tax=Thermoplasma sp. Kam2015 TaxID=2094122 RepID=UPI00137AFB1B|nr:hypothetical protein [Thermoplasma sp. Kam2015]
MINDVLKKALIASIVFAMMAMIPHAVSAAPIPSAVYREGNEAVSFSGREVHVSLGIHKVAVS